jgi:hypothetical protein
MERALASFHAAVARDYGPGEAAEAAGDWIEELGKPMRMSILIGVL